MSMIDWGTVLGLIALCLLMLPPRYDPLIRWRERLEGWRKDRGSEPRT